MDSIHNTVKYANIISFDMKIYLTSLIVFFIIITLIDAVWLYFTVGKFYKAHLSHLWRSELSYSPAIIFYLIYALGVSITILVPSIEHHYSFIKVALMGGFFGMAAYSAYNLTNYATMNGWPLIVVIVDTTWGALVTAASAVITYKILK